MIRLSVLAVAAIALIAAAASMVPEAAIAQKGKCAMQCTAQKVCNPGQSKRDCASSQKLCRQKCQGKM
jgi:hypothetical protein